MWLLTLAIVYLATPWVFVSLAWMYGIQDLRQQGRSYKGIYLATSLYVKVRDVLDIHHWPEGLRMRNDFIRRALLIFAWPLFVDALSEDISGLKQFVHAHTLDERPPEKVSLLECARLSETIGDEEGARDFRRRAEKA